MLLSVKFPIGASDDQATFPNLTGFLDNSVQKINQMTWLVVLRFLCNNFILGKKKGLSYKLINCNFRLGSAACNIKTAIYIFTLASTVKLSEKYSLWFTNCRQTVGPHLSWNWYLFVSWWLVDRQPNVDQHFTDNQLTVDWGSCLYFPMHIWVGKSITGNHKKEIFQCHGNMCKLKWESGVLNLLSP